MNRDHRGVGSALMRAPEDSAWSAGKTLPVLETASGDAERIYQRLGWQPAGTVPDYALWPRRTLQHEFLLSQARVSLERDDDSKKSASRSKASSRAAVAVAAAGARVRA
jgi:hypothetical protein